MSMAGYLSSSAQGPNGAGISSYAIHLTMEMETFPKYGFYIRNWDSIQNLKEQEGFSFFWVLWKDQRVLQKIKWHEKIKLFIPEKQE